MAVQRAIESDSREPARRATAAEQAPLKLEQFLPYQLNVVASLVSQALSRVYARRYRIGVPEWRVLVTLGQYRRDDRQGDRRAYPYAQDQGVARGRASGKAQARGATG